MWGCSAISCRACAQRSKVNSEARSALMGRIVDSYTNILTVKLFARPRDEDRYIRDAIERHMRLFMSAQRLMTVFGTLLNVLNAFLIVGAGALALLLWRFGAVEVGAIAMVLPLTLQLTNMSRQIASQITDIFEDVGVVQEGMMTIAQPLRLIDAADAVPLMVREGRIAFEDVRFGYGRQTGVLQDFNLRIAPGEKIGLIGRSGAGKSTVVNLLLRFFDLESGRILIDGQDISQATQESLRAQISVVTQDTSLLHRSIRENIRYGRPDATEAEIVEAARLAHADEFIPDPGGLARQPRLRRPCGRARRQAVGRPAPAHRHRAGDPAQRPHPGARRGDLRARQRDRGRHPIEPRYPDGRQDRDRHRAPALHHRPHGPPGGARPRPHRRAGPHAALLRLDGHYAALWRRQSGGFLDAADMQAAENRGARSSGGRSGIRGRRSRIRCASCGLQEPEKPHFRAKPPQCGHESPLRTRVPFTLMVLPRGARTPPRGTIAFVSASCSPCSSGSCSRPPRPGIPSRRAG